MFLKCSQSSYFIFRRRLQAKNMKPEGKSFFLFDTNENLVIEFQYLLIWVYNNTSSTPNTDFSNTSKKLLTIPGREASLSITITSIFVEFIVTFGYCNGEYFLEILSDKTFISSYILFYVCSCWFWRSEEIKMCYYHGKTIRNKKEVKSSNTP